MDETNINNPTEEESADTSGDNESIPDEINLEDVDLYKLAQEIIKVIRRHRRREKEQTW
jgi:hypothetical protein